jgi:hypothetical protein
VYKEIKDKINYTHDLTILGIDCYVCGTTGHISVDCLEFDMIKGNLKLHALDKLKQL